MKNLKKVLALALAIALSLTMFAGAAFTDQEEINKTEAVDTLVALGVINGMPDGSFNPDGNVTRAEMAKMIYAVRMRGNTDAGNFAGLSTSFTDLYDTWYRGYVKWAQAAGIIDGKSATTFDPNGSVTGTEAAKMLLVLAGYTSDKAGLTGINWETNTIRYASQAGLLDNMDNVDLSQALPREYAAQLIYNALFIPMVRWSNDSESFVEITNKTQEGDSGVNEITTIGLQYMDLRFYEGTYAANYQTSSTLKNGYIELTAPNSNNTGVISTKVAYDLDLSWLGEEVEVLYQDNNLKGTTTKLDDNDVIYGINKTGNTVVYNITKGDLQDSDSANNKIKFGDVSYDATAQIDVYENYTAAVKKNVDQFDKGTASAAYTGNSADTIKFIVDDQTGKIDTAYVLNKTVGAITTLTSSKVAIRGLAGSAVQDIEEKNIVLYDGAAKGDIVYFYTQFTGEEVETIVEKATTVSGTVSAIRDTNTITINGTNYKMGVAADGQSNIDAEDYDEAVPTVGEEYEVVLYGNYWIGAKALTEASKDYAMVLGSSHNTVTGDTVKLLLADGTTQVMTVHEKSTYKPEETVAGANATLVAYTTTDDGVKLTQIKSGSDDFTLAATAGKKADYDKKTQTLTVDKAVTGSDKYITASNAVAFIYNDSEWKAYSIAQLGDVKGTANTAVYGRTNDNGYATVFAMTADSISGISGADDLVGFVLDDGVTTKDGDDTIISFQVWDGTAEKTVKFLSTDKGDMKAGQYIKIEDFNADTKYDGTAGTGDVTYYTTSNDVEYAAIAANTHAIVKVKDFDAARKVIVITDETYADGKVTPGADGDKSLPLADDYKVIGVTSDENNRGGYETSDVPSYTQVDSASKANAMIILNGDGEVAYIFIDSDNVITVK